MSTTTPIPNPIVPAPIGTRPARLPFMSKTELVAAAIRECIIRGEFVAGTSLRQRELAQRFDVSATPVREALKQLEAEGLVYNKVHSGAVVVESDHGMKDDNYRIRAALESLAANMAAERITPEVLDELERLNLEIESHAGDDVAISDLNRRLHFTIYEHTGSPILLSLMRLLWQTFNPGPQVVRPIEESIREHRDLISALRSADGERAEAVTRGHILGALEHRRRDLRERTLDV